MAEVNIFWDPQGIELDSLGSKSYLRATDGDTPYVSLSIRMLSIDTPELHYPGNKHPSKHDGNLKQLAEWIRQGKAPVTSGLGESLYPKLATGNAGTLHEEQGKKAKEVFQEIIEKALTKPSGRRRRVYLRASNDQFDMYGRLLAYMAPTYTKKERAAMSL